MGGALKCRSSVLRTCWYVHPGSKGTISCCLLERRGLRYMQACIMPEQGEGGEHFSMAEKISHFRQPLAKMGWKDDDEMGLGYTHLPKPVISSYYDNSTEYHIVAP